jgi:hypothetical protein
MGLDAEEGAGDEFLPAMVVAVEPWSSLRGGSEREVSGGNYPYGSCSCVTALTCQVGPPHNPSIVRHVPSNHRAS